MKRWQLRSYLGKSLGCAVRLHSGQRALLHPQLLETTYHRPTQMHRRSAPSACRMLAGMSAMLTQK